MRQGWTVSILVLLAPQPSQAHLVSTGVGPFYDGLSHVALSPDALLGLVALALLTGLRGPRFGRAALFLVPLAWLPAGILGLLFPTTESLPLATSVSFLLLGLLVALDRPLPLLLCGCLALGLGALLGYLNGTAMARSGLGTTGLLGTLTAVFVLVTLFAALAAWLRTSVARIAVRVAGSWIAAIGLLMLGWLARGSR